MKLGLLAVLLLAVAVVIVGCSDSADTLTLEEYFAEFEVIDADYDDQIGALFVDFPEDPVAFEDDATLPFAKGFAAGFGPIVDNFIDQLRELDPPAEVEESHEELIAAGETLVDGLEEANDILQEAETMAEFGALENSLPPTLATAPLDFVAACLEIVEIAVANESQAIITCQDE